MKGNNRGGVDFEWFSDTLEAKEISQRKLAGMIDLEYSALNRMLHGQRKMTLIEAQRIGAVLGLPVTEIIRRAGIDVRDDVTKIALRSYMDSNGSVIDMPAGTHEMALAPANCLTGSYAIQVRSPATIKDGWVLFVAPDHVGAQLNIDHLCLCATSSGDQIVGVVRRGYRSRTFNVVKWPSMELLTDNELAWTASIMWIQPN